MQKILFLMMLLVLLNSSGYAEESLLLENVNGVSAAGRTKYDMVVFEELDTYHYDKFDKEWSCYGEYVKQYSDASVVCGIQIEGTSEGPGFLPYIYTWIRRENNIDPYYEVESIDIMVNDTIYTYPQLQATNSGSPVSYVFMGSNNGKELIDAMADADSISLRLHYSGGKLTLDVSPETYEENILPIVQALIEYDIWSYIIDPKVTDWEKAYPLEVK